MSIQIITPTVSIFDKNGKFDYNGNQEVLEFLIKGGVDGVLPLGSTGEFTHLSLEEKKDIFEFYVKTVDKRITILAGTGCMNFDETIELSNFALNLGIKGVVVIGPYYYALDQRKIFTYYDKLAKSINGNLYIYNYEARSGHNMSAKTTYELCKANKNIKGMKDSTSSIPHTKEVLYAVKDDFKDFEMYSGFDDHFLANVIAGGSGCIAALSNLVPEIWSDWVRAVNNKDFQKTFKIARVIDNLMQLYNLDCNFSYLFKYLMKNQGLNIQTYSVFPFEAIDENILKQAIKILEDSKKIYRSI